MRGPFLIVEDDRTIVRALERMLEPYGTSRAAYDAVEGRSALRSTPVGGWAGFVFDVELGNGSGLDLLREARAMYPEVPALVTTGGLCVDRVNGAARLSAHFVAKPFGAADLKAFVDDVLRTDLNALIERLSGHWGLTPRERDVTHAAFAGQSSDAFVRAHSISPNTYKSHVRGVLQKSGYANLNALVAEVLRRRLQSTP